ncbi:MAG: PAS domain S-box protein [Deltaproteobacteria bacterium]|nr:PAS domain S-box protein [Deltaproteobacteria bacterium]
MAGHTDPADQFEQLREQAEALIRERPDETSKSPLDILELIQELEVHQTELEIQNEELRRTQEELSTLHREYENLYEFAPCGYLTLNPKGIITHINLTGLTLLGGPRTHVLHQGMSQFIEPGQEDSLLSARKKSAETGEKQSVEFPLRRGKGTPVWVRADIEADRDDAGAVIQWRVVLVDITEHKQAQEALFRSEEKYRSLFNSIRDAILVADTDRKIMSCNPAFTELFGHSEKEITGKETRYVYESEVQFTEMGERLKENMDNPHFLHTIHYRKRSGEVFPGETNVFYLRDTDGNINGFIGLIRDITERQKAEEAKVRLEAQLQQAQKMESVGRLAGGVAHDFNNKLTSILGYAELAMGRLDPSHALYGDLKQILEAGKQSVNIVRQLLAFARKQTIAPKVMILNDTVEQMLRMLRRLIGEDIDLAWEPDANIWPVKMDPSQIDQILANLCVNARDAIEGVGKVTIETENVELDEAYCAGHAGFVPGEYVMLAVSDDGAGMDKETLANVFEPFFTTKAVGKGTGLGLSTVYGIVKQNHGFVNAYSEPGKGTTFRIYLPRHEGEAEGKAEAVESEIPLGRGETILIVEDEKTVLQLGKMILERLGYTVLAAESPVEAVEIVRKESGEIHLLMTDVVMPRMSGKALVEEIQNIRPDIKTLFMSGYTANAIAHQGVLDEGVHFIQKPFGLKSLARKVRGALGSENGTTDGHR